MCRLNFGLIQTRFIYFFPFHEYYIHIAEAWKTAGIILHVLIVAITLPRSENKRKIKLEPGISRSILWNCPQ